MKSARLWLWVVLAGCVDAGGGGVSDAAVADGGGVADAAVADDGGVADADPGPADAEPDAAAPADAGSPDAAPERGDQPRLAFPIAPDDRDLMNAGLMFGYDHGPGGERTVCTAYDGDPFPACYGGHEGSDFILVGGFRQMDERSAQVVAAAGGEVIRVEDGHYDRCRGDLASLEVTCDGHEMRANMVVIAHPGGWETHYLHLKRGSVLVRVGQRVDCGHLLGLVGSSGYSTMPHVHLEVVDPRGRSVDPFTVDPRDSLWREQDTGDVRPANGCDPIWGPAD